MNKATELLSKAGTFFIATADGDQPRVRPFGAVAEFDGKTYICMNNTKKVFKQLVANPKIEITATFDGGGKWFRLQAVANRDDRLEARTKMLE
ncbi:MAG: pyridoxamine 5'-phosphate oxidase family protein, partial [Oscillospiraceae bacterium]|nr:pyridoxamine 5'-phosphate oxidase family protein [Oscillospiraceae bacterium]